MTKEPKKNEFCNLKFQDLWSWIKIWTNNSKKIQETHEFDQEKTINHSKKVKEFKKIKNIIQENQRIQEDLQEL